MGRFRKFWRKMVKPRWQNHRWLIIAGLWLATLILGYVGFSRYFVSVGELRSIADRIYLTIQLFVLESGSAPGPKSWELEVARLMAPAITALTAIQALALIFREQLQDIQLRFIKNHSVICALGRKGLLLAERLIEDGNKVVVIEKDEENSHIARCRNLGALVLIGNCLDKKLLQKAGVTRAANLIAVSGSDGVNAEAVVLAHELKKGHRGRPLNCSAHITDTHLCDLLRERHLMMEETATFQLDFFSTFDLGARAMLDEFPPFTTNNTQPGATPHLLVTGLGNMGESLVVRAARDWVNERGAEGARLPITIVDREADWKTRSLEVRYPQMTRYCNLMPVQTDVRGADFLQPDFAFDAEGNCGITNVYICLDNDSLGLAAALALSNSIKDQRVPIVVRMERDKGLASLLHGQGPGAQAFSNLHAFGLLERTCTPELCLGGVYEILARATHEEYVRHKERNGHAIETDSAMAPWEKLDEGFQQSSRQQANHIGAKLQAVGCDIEPLRDWDATGFEFTPDEVELMARMEHERWVQERIEAGWKSGPRDSEKKTTPYLVPWDELTEEIKDYDRDPVLKLPVFLAKAGFQIYRTKKQ